MVYVCVYAYTYAYMHMYICMFKHQHYFYISYTLGREYRVVRIDIHGCYSLVKIAFAPICACKNNRRIWRHNASISGSRDVTDPLWWRHNAKSETTVLGDNGEMSDRWLFLAELCLQDIKQRVRNKIIHSLPWTTILGSLVMRFAKISKLRVTGLRAGNSSAAGEFPAQSASNAENVSIWWRHHALGITRTIPKSTQTPLMMPMLS